MAERFFTKPHKAPWAISHTPMTAKVADSKMAAPTRAIAPKTWWNFSRKPAPRSINPFLPCSLDIHILYNFYSLFSIHKPTTVIVQLSSQCYNMQMSTSEAVEFNLDGYDFRDELSRALECAPFLEFSASGEATLKTLEIYGKLDEAADKPPDALVTVDNDTEPSDVITDDPDAYPALVHQARKMIYPFLNSETINRDTKDSLEHEMAHAAAATKLGQVVQYGVRLAKKRVSDHEVRVLMSTFIYYDGQELSKADLAFIAAAPEMPSESDQHLVRTLGYTSCKQALESHPLFSSPSIA